MTILLYGHIHKTNFDQNGNILYSGSPISMGFDELGEHGVIKGEFSDKLHLQFIKTDNKEFVEKLIDVSSMNSIEDLIEYINSIDNNDRQICKIILTGCKNFELTNNLLEMVGNNIIKIKDNTKENYDIESISSENSLKGLFLRNLLNKLENEPENKAEIEKAIRIGLELF